jgi:hydrophobic/amphiphilic exporter-1 (mainly G- bacteria), HAE1 family
VVTVLIAVLVLAGTVALTPLIKTNFLDDSGQSTLRFTQSMPAGSSLQATDAAARQVEAVLAGEPEIETSQVTIGSAGGLMAFQPGAGSSTASYSLTVRAGTDVDALENTLRARLDALPGAGRITMGGGGDIAGNKLSVTVNASDPDTLRQAADAVQQAVAGTPNTTDVASDLVNNQPRVDVVVDRAAAARHGLTPLVIGQAVSQQLGGSRVAQLTLDGQQQDVLLRTGTAPGDLGALRALTLPSATGPVRLDAVAQVNDTAGPATIQHVDGTRSATITATATSQNTGAVNKDLRDRLDALRLPAGASYTIGGVTQQQSSAFGDLGIALLVAIALVYLVMAAVFGSLLQPLILLVSVPFAATGALLALIGTGTPLGLPALIGMLMLVGIVVTNAIVLMDLINKYRAAGLSIAEAVVDGGRRRLRPILMTAAATVFALAPMALGLTGSGGFISRPLAIVVIGGLVSSTLLTLVLVPALYAMVETRRERFRSRRTPAPVAAERGGNGHPPAERDPLADTLTRYQQAWTRAGQDQHGERPADAQAAQALAAWSRRYLGRGGGEPPR